MEINEVNKKIYEDSFISDGEYGDLNNWKPDIDERLIEESCEDENGNWVPATPLGYRDYKLSREEGIRNIIYNTDAARAFTYEDAHHIKRVDNIIKKYDKITIDNTPYVVMDSELNECFLFTSSPSSSHFFFLPTLPFLNLFTLFPGPSH